MAYFSNGTEGSILDEQCAVCPVGRDPDAPCPVLWVQTNWNYKQIVEGKREGPVAEILTSLVDDNGKCQMKKAIEEADTPEIIIPEDLQCPLCGCQDFNAEHQRSTGAAGEHWTKTCAACGYEYREGLT